jgi:hypothetical protein
MVRWREWMGRRIGHLEERSAHLACFSSYSMNAQFKKNSI